LGSFAVSVHVPAQTWNGAGQSVVHWPAEQYSPTLHVVPHAPQSRVSLCRLAQCPSHSVVPPEQPSVHAPREQIDPASQA
jgi:hypothetical protein